MLSGELKSGLERYKAIQTIANAGLSNDPISGLFRYAKIHWNTMFFVFSHPGGKYEFELRKEQILAKMRLCYKTNNQYLTKNGVYFTGAKALYIAPPIQQYVVTVVKKEPEVAEGNFENRAKNPALYAVFEEIRKTIKENRRDR